MHRGLMHARDDADVNEGHEPLFGPTFSNYSFAAKSLRLRMAFDVQERGWQESRGGHKSDPTLPGLEG